MADVVHTRSARRDVVQILQRIANEAGKATATEFASKFEAVFARLAEHPLAYQTREVLGPDIRIVPVRPYIILYRHDATSGVVSILRVLHGHREITADFMRLS